MKKFEFTKETKNNISLSLGIDYEELIKMSQEEQDAFIEKKLGKKPKFDKTQRVDGYPISTMDDVDKKMSKIFENTEKPRER